MLKYDVIIIGGGAAGLMCAMEAGKRGRSVLVIEHKERVGLKILISGGGRCNFTNLNAAPENYLSANPNFCRSALARFTPDDFIALVERHRITYHEKKLGQLFCDFTSRSIVDLLLAECTAGGVKIQVNCRVERVEKPDAFRVGTERGEFTCESLVVATGGLSFPKLGATDLGYRIARQFGIKVTGTQPGLVPITLGADQQRVFGQLSGVSLDVEATCAGVTFRENLLVTHRGLSGPAILQVSSYRRNGEPLLINLMPDHNAQELLMAERGAQKELKTFLGQFWTQRFAQEWCAQYAPSRPLNRYSTPELEGIARQIHRWEIAPAGTEGYAKAEVTVGGVDTGELSSKTMVARSVPGLYFIGEVVDVTGWLGGYNFQWAWASGFAAGQVV